jgi:transcriptional regulator with XRE-family HTH domain
MISDITMTQTTTPGQRIKAARLAAGLTVGELAQRLAVTPERVRNLELGQRNPSLKMLLRIALAIPCDPQGLDPTLASQPVFPRS